MPEKRNPIKIDPEGKEATVLVNTKLYPPEVIYSAAYVFLDKAHFLFDGDPKKEVVVTIKPKEAGLDLKRLCLDFSNELINYSVYVIQAARKQAIREAIIRRALAPMPRQTNQQTRQGKRTGLTTPRALRSPGRPTRQRG
jgi:His-Xaa-Ser system protein HxsD